MPTWSSDDGFVTITFKRPFFKANTIETNGEDNRTSKRDNLRSTTAQVPTKFRPNSRSVRKYTMRQWMTCASHRVGWCATWRTKRRGNVVRKTSGTYLSDMPTVIPASSFWPVPNLYSQNMNPNGHRRSGGEPILFLNSIQN